jgi:GDPmannose 4,6-dehydratase
MRRALITGITGQDGLHPQGLPRAESCWVRGIIRRASLFNTHRVDHPRKHLHRHGTRFAFCHDEGLGA